VVLVPRPPLVASSLLGVEPIVHGLILRWGRGPAANLPAATPLAPWCRHRARPITCRVRCYAPGPAAVCVLRPSTRQI
jgi:hypothetical protein